MSWLYIDSSTLVSMALTDPLRVPEADKHVHRFTGIITSHLSRVECHAGICSQLHPQPELMAAAEQNLNRIFSRMLILSVNSRVVDRARLLIRQHRMSLGLRSADAIHVATTMEFQTIVGSGEDTHVEYLTSDKKQHQAFSAEGLEGHFLP